MILARWKSEWLLATRASPGFSGCALSGGDWTRLESLGFVRYTSSVENYPTYVCWRKSVPSLDGINFFPEVRYRGAPVAVDQWHTESAEPLVRCFLGDMNPLIDQTGPTMNEILAANRAKDYDTWRRLCREREECGQAVVQRLKEEGWESIGRDGFCKYIHVDELEKIEGPPPEGAF